MKYVIIMGLIVILLMPAIRADSAWQSGSRTWGECFWGADCPSEAGGVVGGGGGADTSPIPTKCYPYIVAYNDCFYLDVVQKMCIRGCPNGYECSNFSCTQGNQTVEELIKMQEEVTQKTWLENFLDYAREILTPAQLSVLNSEKPSTAETTILTESEKNINKQAFVLLASGIVILIMLVLMYGWEVIFLNPINVTLIMVAIFAGYIFIKYRMFG